MGCAPWWDAFVRCTILLDVIAHIQMHRLESEQRTPGVLHSAREATLWPGSGLANEVEKGEFEGDP